jgi:hypothetical protein
MALLIPAPLGRSAVTTESSGVSQVCSRMRWIVILAICPGMIGCGNTAQQQSARTVAAFEVPLPSEADHAQFLSMLRAAAAAEGLHVDAASSEELENKAEGRPAFKMTMNATVWQGANDDEPIASAMDQPDHLGQIWLAFFKGQNPTLNSRLRESIMCEILRRWPGTLSLPIMPTGAIPLHSDLVRTPSGYVVNPAEAHKYDLAGTERRSQ